MQFQEITGYSPTFDCEVTRVSVVASLADLNRCDPYRPEFAGREYFCLVPRANIRRWREARARVLEQMQQAISAGLEPGEVPITLDA